MKPTTQTVLITGGSSGIGFEMSKIWASKGYRLLWVSLKSKELEQAKSSLLKEFPETEIHSLEKDLSLPNGPEQVFQWARKIGLPNVLINNAGFGTYGYVQEINQEKELAMIQLNVVGLYKMTRLFLDEMLMKNEGTIINICSNSAFQPVPRMTTYAATKGFVYQFSRGLQEELEIQNSKVRVQTVCPSAIADTPFRNQLNSEVKTFNGLATTTAKEVAKDTWKGFQNGETFVVTGWKMRMLYRIKNFIPYAVQQFMVRKETESQ